jgi:glycosyltransferase involved in cell wall biosynthesis
VQLLHLVAGLHARGWSQWVACPPAGRLWTELAFLGDRRIAVPAGASLVAGLRAWRTGADLVAAHTSHAHQSAAPFPVRLVVHRRVDFQPSGGWKYRRPDGYVAVSQAVADIVSAAGGRRVHVVFDGVLPLPAVAPAVDGPMVLAVGARVPHKGHVHLVAAAALLHAQHPDLDIGVAGDGPLTWPGVRWLGQRDDVPALLAAARVFVHPSVEEGMGQAVVEAMLAGVPVVVSDAGGLPEVVGDTGLIVPAGDPVALAAAVERVLRGRHPPTSAARDRALLRFSVDAMVDGTAAAYRQLVAG